ncbi:MAG: hypothetical protein WDA11_10055 [Thiohalomonadaceae bacterium]
MQSARITRISPLELAMRDVRENLSDFAAGFGLDAGASHTFMILAIEPAPCPVPRKTAQVVPHPVIQRRATR